MRNFRRLVLVLVLVSTAGVSWGDCVEGDCYNGKGKYSYADGPVYEGDWQKGHRTGKGKMTWPNGDVYEGDWQKGHRAGKGKYTWPNGDVYEGDWQKNQRTGKGKMTYASGGVKEGVFQDGTFLGTEAEVERKEKRRLAQLEVERILKAAAKAKFQKIFNACLLDKSSGMDMQVKSIEAAVKATCEAIAEDPSWLESLQYD